MLIYGNRHSSPENHSLNAPLYMGTGKGRTNLIEASLHAMHNYFNLVNDLLAKWRDHPVWSDHCHV